MPSSPTQRTVLLYPDEDGYIIAEVPSLPGCVSQGETREEALQNIQEAIDLHTEVLHERGQLASKFLMFDDRKSSY